MKPVTVTVTKQFKDDFDTWSAERIKWGDFTKEDMAEFKEMLRTDMQPGPDQLRQGLEFITAAGVTVPAMIDNYEERYRVWSVYFADEASQIRRPMRKAA